MSQALHVIKVIGAWGCLVAAIVLLILARETAGLPMLLSVMSIGFSQLPEG